MRSRQIQMEKLEFILPMIIVMAALSTAIRWEFQEPLIFGQKLNLPLLIIKSP